MTDQPTCDRCGHPTRDTTAYVCDRCRDRLREDLATVAKVAGEASVTIARLDQVERAGAGQHEPEDTTCVCRLCEEGRQDKAANALAPKPWPVDLGAAQRHDEAVSQLITWVRHIVETRGLDVPVATGHPLAAAAAWLGGQLDWLRHRPEATEAFDVLTGACWTIVNVVDRPADRGSLGACGVDVCTEELRQVAGATVVRCGGCGVEHDVAERCARLLRLAEDYWDIAAALAHLLTEYGVPCTAEMIRGYAHRGRLAPHPESSPTRPRYRLGSVRELVDEQHRLVRERRLRAAVQAAERADRRARRDARAREKVISNGTVGASSACPDSDGAGLSSSRAEA